MLLFVIKISKYCTLNLKESGSGKNVPSSCEERNPFHSVQNTTASAAAADTPIQPELCHPIQNTPTKIYPAITCRRSSVIPSYLKLMNMEQLENRKMILPLHRELFELQKEIVICV